ncbi:MAG TPA: hypothetical protein VNK43_10220 [Gemmatimonadales bacterium]|nr:hypothetical protein [Gemmatimonadales bacterium]
MRTALLVFVGLALVAAPLSGQGRPLQVRGVRSLSFGLLLPGIPTSTARTDPALSGELEIRGERNLEVVVTFGLPSAMTGPGGAVLPLAFAANDAGYSGQQSIGSQTAFDPRLPFRAVLSRNGRGSIYLGGTALPGNGQRAGTYTAQITLTVAYTSP